ncbi:MAG: YcaO-like family protein [Candidatus Blackburnbacteria bacterium]|nr:YcaO-like family protein [Candidatus Blackburnbacteria bacterium]
MFQSLSAQAKILFNAKREISSGGLGINRHEDKAFLACIAEAIERYCMSFFDINKFFFGSWNELPLPENRIDNFHLYSDEQYARNVNFANPKKSKIYWEEITNYTNKKQHMYWPASLIYLPFDYGLTAAESTSTGVACNSSLKACVTSGLLELIERDAIMINFMQRLNPPELDINSIKGKNLMLVGKITRKYQLKIYKLYSDISVPIFLGLIWHKEGSIFHYGIGACAHLNSEEALHKTLKECLFTNFYSKNLLHLRQSDPTKINTLYEHFLYYQSDNFPKLLFKKSTVIKYERKACNLRSLIGELAANGLSIYYKEITTPDIKPIGLKVVKVIVPGLIDLNKSHLLRREGALRFWSVPQKLELQVRQKLYSSPHPFP